MQVIERFVAGDRRALARLISLVEDGAHEGKEAMRLLHSHTGRTHVLGITGPPGVGKSTLVNQLAKALRRLGKTIGIIAVDPSSPFTEGALLGDRIRMQELCGDTGIFLRSMATRGSLGGLARATNDVVVLLDAFGKDVVIVETVGVGQDEVEIARTAHTTVVVEMPGSGDDIQSMKAGILEVADIFVVNKAERDGADRVTSELERLAAMACSNGWQIPVINTVATMNQGIDDLVGAVERHWYYLKDSGKLEQDRTEWARRQILAITQQRLLEHLLESAQRNGSLEDLTTAVAERRLDPHSAAEELLAATERHSSH